MPFSAPSAALQILSITRVSQASVTRFACLQNMKYEMHRISGILHAAPMCALSGLHASQKYTLVLNKTCPKECICRLSLAKPLCGHSHIENIDEGWQRANRRLQRLLCRSASLSAHSGHPVWLLAPNRWLHCCTRTLKEQRHPFHTVAHIHSLQHLLCVQVRSGARDCPEYPTVSIRAQHRPCRSSHDHP
jgi:hypothetical protein